MSGSKYVLKKDQTDFLNLTRRTKIKQMLKNDVYSFVLILTYFLFSNVFPQKMFDVK